jgi:hypothetical protein
MKKLLRFCLLVFIMSAGLKNNWAQESIAETWTNHLLFAIKNDFARPTMHARNLFHSSIAMHDAWAAYDASANFYFLGQTHGGQFVAFNGVAAVEDTLSAQQEAICYAMFRLMTHRFQNSPGALNSIPRINMFMDSLNYDRNITSIDYINDGPAALGNYIASQLIAFGYLDGSNEAGNYANQYYSPIQGPVEPEFPGNPDMIDPNRWQPIALSYAVDQAGNILTSNPPFLSPEWGNVTPFALPSSAMNSYTRDGDTYQVYHDPGDPPYLDTSVQTQLDDLYKWNHTMVSVWQSHLDPNDTTMWDISPASVGNIQSYPTQFVDYPNFYNYFDGGDAGMGYNINPVTNMPYTPQMVKRADYARVLAEFWADGLDSETPPGHWFNIYNEVRHHPLFENKWQGVGPELSNLEYDVKAYLTMGGAMHDAAIAAWSVKGWYDYARPVSALRYMAEKGQSTIDTLSNYHPAGLPLVPGFIEIVDLGDPLVGAANEHLGKIKLYTWRGPDYIPNPNNTYAGVGWILAENWWPYQRPSFVTPPFAGYVSGHSTFSRAAAEVMTFITGDPFFPGGMSSFVAQENEFLEFEEGPSTDIILEWATYRDASDQCSLSRIWGGIHPPADDINGRLMGIEIGTDASFKADSIFTAPVVRVDSIWYSAPAFSLDNLGQTLRIQAYYSNSMNTLVDPSIRFEGSPNPLTNTLSLLGGNWLSNQVYEWSVQVNNSGETIKPIHVLINYAQSATGLAQLPYVSNTFELDLKRPVVLAVNPSTSIINDATVAGNFFYIDILFDEECDTSVNPSIQFNTTNVLNTVLFASPAQSIWLDSASYRQVYTLIDTNTDIDNIEFVVDNGTDGLGNQQIPYLASGLFEIATSNPEVISFTWTDSLLNRADFGSQWGMTLSFNKAMDISSALTPDFSVQGVFPGLLDLNNQSQWLDSSNLVLVFNVNNLSLQADSVDLNILSFKDLNGNAVDNYFYPNALLADTKRPELLELSANARIVSDNQSGSSNFLLDLTFDEAMNTSEEVIAELFYNGSLSEEIHFKVFQSFWINDTIYQAVFEVEDNDIELQGHELRINFAEDFANNPQDLVVLSDFINLDTRNPRILSLTASSYDLDDSDVEWRVTAVFDELMDTSSQLMLDFIDAPSLSNHLVLNNSRSSWLAPTVFEAVYDVLPGSFNQEYVRVIPRMALDTALNEVVSMDVDSFVSVKFEALGIQDLAEELSLYPVPAKAGEFINFEFNRHFTQLKVSFINILGQGFEAGLGYSGSGNGVVLVPDQLAGVYFIEFRSANIVVARRAVYIK